MNQVNNMLARYVCQDVEQIIIGYVDQDIQIHGKALAWYNCLCGGCVIYFEFIKRCGGVINSPLLWLEVRKRYYKNDKLGFIRDTTTRNFGIKLYTGPTGREKIVYLPIGTINHKPYDLM